MPEVFGDAEQFDAWFSLSDAGAKDNVIKKLHTVLRPFMLRRVKKDVAKSLPPKKETKLYIGLTKMQQEWYVSVLRKDAHELNKLGGPEKSRLLNVLMQLRKVCNHPYLFDGAEAGPPCKFKNTIDKCCISYFKYLSRRKFSHSILFSESDSDSGTEIDEKKKDRSVLEDFEAEHFLNENVENQTESDRLIAQQMQRGNPSSSA